MPSESRQRRSAFDQPNLFGPPDQGDMFGPAPAPQAFVPKHEHVLNGCKKALLQLQDTKHWYEGAAVDAERIRNRTPSYYCGLLLDEAEKRHWRAIFDAEIARIDAATPAQAPEDWPYYHDPAKSLFNYPYPYAEGWKWTRPNIGNENLPDA